MTCVLIARSFAVDWHEAMAGVWAHGRPRVYHVAGSAHRRPSDWTSFPGRHRHPSDAAVTGIMDLVPAGWSTSCLPAAVAQ